jgi:fructokinase
MVFGSLAQRGGRTRRTVRALCEKAPDALKVLDVNLRPPHTPRRVVEPSLALADVVKLNEEELVEIGAWLDRAGEPGNARGVRSTVAALARRFDCRAVCVTRGADGNALWRGGEWTRHDSYPVEVRDTVGAGDAFLAALLTGLLDDHDSDTVLDRASRLGAYVASRSGATPAYDVDGWEGIPRLALNDSGSLHPAR